MIKAEAITHEGNVGPNWLDHCRTHVTPGRITTSVVVLALALGGIGLAHHRNTTPVVTHTTTVQSDTGNSLKVEPLEQQSTTNADGLPSLQAPTTATPASNNQQSSDASKLGGGAAPTLTRTQTPGQSSYRSKASSAATNLTNTINTTVNNTTSGVTNTLTQLLSNQP